MMDPKHVKPDSLLMSPSVKFKFRWWFSRIYIHVIFLGLLRAVALPLSNAIPTWVAYLPSQLALFFLVIRAISFGFYLVEKDQLNSTHQGVGLHVWVTVAVAVILQLRHPLVAAGVRHHSKISMRRLLRTTIFANVFLNGSFSDQEKVIEWLSRVHRNIKGTVLLSDIVQGDPDMAAAADLDLVGAEYGLSEELQVWVLATAAYSYVWFHRNFGRPLSENRADEFCATLMMIAHRLGVPAERLPLTYSATEALVHKTLLRFPPTTPFRHLVAVSKVEFTKTSYSLRVLVNHILLLASRMDPFPDNSTIERSPSFIEQVWFQLTAAATQFICDVAPTMNLSGVIILMVFLDPSLRKTLDATLDEIGVSADSSILEKQDDVFMHDAHCPSRALRWLRLDNRLNELDHWLLECIDRTIAGVTTIPFGNVIPFWWAIAQSYYSESRRTVLNAISGAHSRVAKRRLEGVQEGNMPVHVGIVMDGNRRWARNRGLDVIHGHSEGALKLVEIVQWWMEHNGGKLRYMTVWAFSTDNFNRPASEVDGLMKLIGRELQRLVHFPHVHMFRIRISVVGDRSRLPQSLIDGIKAIEHATASYDSFFWQIAVAYSGQGEIVSSVRDALMTSVVENSGSGQCDMTAAGPSGPSLADRLAKLDTGAISQCTYNGRLGFPRANAILRTGGDWRTSGFMLWDTQYAELFFSKKMWPDIKEWDFLNMLVDYNKREIRHGK